MFDNGTAFLGRNEELKKLHVLLYKFCDALSIAFASEDANWKFLSPCTPNLVDYRRLG